MVVTKLYHTNANQNNHWSHNIVLVVLTLPLHYGKSPYLLLTKGLKMVCVLIIIIILYLYITIRMYVCILRFLGVHILYN